MLLTWSTAAMGLIGFGAQTIAHLLMWETGQPERAPTPRYAVGLGIVGVCFSIGLALEPQQDPIAAFWYNALLSGAATGLCYEVRRRHAADTLPALSLSDLDRFANVIAEEHDDAP